MPTIDEAGTIFNKKNSQIAANAIDFGNENTSSLALIGVEGKLVNGYLGGVTHIDVAPVPSKKPNLVTLSGGFGTINSQSEYLEKKYPTKFYYTGISTTPRLIQTGRKTLSGLGQGKDGLYLNASCSYYCNNATGNKGFYRGTQYAGLKYIGGNEKFQADAGVKFDKDFSGGKEYVVNFTKRFPGKISSRSSNTQTNFYVKVGGVIDSAFKKISPQVSAGVSLTIPTNARNLGRTCSSRPNPCFSW